MAIFTNLVPTDDVQDDDEILMRQGLTDKRINFNLADVIAWGTREGSVYLGAHTSSAIYDTVNSFRLFNNQPYFVKVGVALPYTTTSSNPLLDSNLTNMSYTDYKRTVDASRAIGDTMLRFDSKNPKDLYPWQTWSLISGDASIRLGDGAVQSKTPSGDNNPIVPVQQHSHAMNHTHPRGTTFTDTHSHGYLDRGQQINNGTGNVGVANSQSFLADFSRTTSNNSHSHMYDTPEHSGTTSNSGVDGATLDVRGKSIKMNLWVRTA